MAPLQESLLLQSDDDLSGSGRRLAHKGGCRRHVTVTNVLLAVNMVFSFAVFVTLLVVNSNAQQANLFPNLINAVAASSDPYRWKAVLDNFQTFGTKLAKVDWAINETQAYTVTFTCADQYNEQDCEAFVGDEKGVCRWAIPKDATWYECLGHAAQTKSYYDVGCSYFSYDPTMCSEQVGIHGGHCDFDYSYGTCEDRAGQPNATVIRLRYEESCVIDRSSSNMVDDTINQIVNAAATVSKTLQATKDGGVHSSLDITVWLDNMLKADWNKLSKNCRDSATWLASADWGSFFGSFFGCNDPYYCKDQVASMQVVFRGISDICSKVLAANLNIDS